MKQHLVKFVKFLIYLTFFVPLLVFPASFIFPFIVPKILTFRALVELMLGGYIVLLCINWQEFRPKFSWLNLALAAFFVSFTVSTFAGVDPYHSFWDNHERMLGLFTIFHYIAYYFICSSVFKTWDEWKKALRIFLIAGSIVMVIGVMQIFNSQLLLNQGSDRVIATLGNPIYVGGYGLFLVFVSLLLFLTESNKVWKWSVAAMALFAVVGMFYSGTRGSMLGLAVGLACMVLGYILVLKQQKKVRNILIGVAAVGVALVVLLYAFRQTAFVSNIPAVGRAVNTTYTVLKSTPRWIAWGVAFKSWEERPVFGWGPNNFFYAFNNNYNPKSLLYGYGETWFDNAHNIVMNTLAVQGMVGLVIYLMIFIAGILSVVFAYRKGRLNMHVAVIGSAFLVAHLVQNVTVFENPTSYLYFMFWLALINQTALKLPLVSAPAGTGSVKNPVWVDKKVSSGAAVAVGAVMVLIVFIFSIQPARANIKTLNALKMLTYAPSQGIELTKEALAFNSPHIDDIRSDLGRTIAQILSSSDNMNKMGKEQSLELFNLADSALTANIQLHPLDIRNYLTLSQLYQAGYALTGDAKYIAQYGSNLETALRYSPKRQQIIYNLANFYLQTGQFDTAIKMLEETIVDEKSIAETYWRLAYVYQLTGKKDKAKEVLALAATNGIVFDEQQQGIIAQILSSTPIK